MAYTLNDLAEADLQVMQAERLIEMQRRMIERMNNDDASLGTAQAVLASFEDTLATRRLRRDRIAEALAQL